MGGAVQPGEAELVSGRASVVDYLKTIDAAVLADDYIRLQVATAHLKELTDPRGGKGAVAVDATVGVADVVNARSGKAKAIAVSAAQRHQVAQCVENLPLVACSAGERSFRHEVLKLVTAIAEG